MEFAVCVVKWMPYPSLLCDWKYYLLPFLQFSCEKIIHYKESVRKIIVMRPNRVRKKCSYYLIAVYPITFLGIRMEFLHAVFCITLLDDFFKTYVTRVIIGELRKFVRYILYITLYFYSPSFEDGEVMIDSY